MHIDEELDYLNQIILKMADTVKSNIIESCTIYKGDVDKDLVINDDIVDQYERMVEEICLNIILKERPYAKDLRKVTGILKMVSDLERIGDHAEDIMEFNIKLKKCNKAKIESINLMLKTALDMVMDSILSFTKEDIALANDVIKRDDIVDKLYEDIIEYLINATAEQKVSPDFAIYNTLLVTG
jgi:phosphate transport system protein